MHCTQPFHEYLQNMRCVSKMYVVSVRFLLPSVVHHKIQNIW